MSRRPSLLESPLSYVSPRICSMTVWCRRFSIRIRLVCRSGSLSYSLLPKLVRAFLNQRARRSTYRHCPGVPPDDHIAPGNQAQRIQLSRFQLAVIASVAVSSCTSRRQTGYFILRILFCRGSGESHGFRYVVPDFSRESCTAARMHTDPESCLPKETEVHANALDSAATCDAGLCLTTILQRCVYPATRCQAPLASRRPLFAPCLPSTCSRACVQSPCGSLRFITLTVLNRGEVAVVGHCKFAEMLYSSDELVVVVCFFSKTASIISTTATGQSVKSVYAFIHYAFGGVCATSAIRTLALHFGFGAEQACSAAAISGHLLAAHLGRFPSSTVCSSLGFFYEAFPHSEVRCLWTLLWCGPLSLLHCVHVPCGTLLYAVGTSSGADGRVSRLRSSSPTAIVSSTSSLSRIASAESLRSGAVGCVSRPRSSTWRSSLFSISFLFFLASSRIACYCSLMTLVLGISIFKFSSGVVSRSTGVERLVLFHLPAELEFLCGR